jgi:hypothetical protein
MWVGHNHTQDTGRRQTRQITQHYMCWTQPYCVLCMVVSNTYSVVLFVLFVVVCVLCMVVSNTYSVVLFVLFVVVNNTTLCMLDTTIHKKQTTTNKTINTTLFVLDTTIHRTTTIKTYYLSCLSSSVSCVWLCPTYIVLCYLSWLSSSCVWLCPTQIVLC